MLNVLTFFLNCCNKKWWWFVWTETCSTASIMWH